MDEYIKTFCGIPEGVKVYDSQIELNKGIALTRLKIAGVSSDEKNNLVIDYVATFCRLRMITEPSNQFVQTEQARLTEIITLLTYGKEVTE